MTPEIGRSASIFGVRKVAAGGRPPRVPPSKVGVLGGLGLLPPWFDWRIPKQFGPSGDVLFSFILKMLRNKMLTKMNQRNPRPQIDLA